MISKGKIKKNVVCYWSVENESFVAESALIPHVVTGVGDTEDAAIVSFSSALDDIYDELTVNNVAGYSKTGRPTKGYVPFNANISPTSKEHLSRLANELEISQGEAVDYLVFYRDCKLQEHHRIPSKPELVKMLDNLVATVSSGFQQLGEKIDRAPYFSLEMLQLVSSQTPAWTQTNGENRYQALPPIPGASWRPKNV